VAIVFDGLPSFGDSETVEVYPQFGMQLPRNGPVKSMDQSDVDYYLVDDISNDF
jgi:hypothetical protein